MVSSAMNHLSSLWPWALGLVVLAVVMVWAWVAAAARVLRLEAFFDEVHQVPTPDGATVTLCRLRPRGPVSEQPPVLFCHGLAMNRRAFALDPDRSFAAALAATGRDVWVLELRGAAPGTAPRHLRAATFDTYATVDVPLAIEQVRAVTGAEALDWVGFSMGGMLAYAHLGALGGGGILGRVTIGSPVHFERHPIGRGVAVAPLLFAPARVLTRTPFRFLSLLAAPLLWPGLPDLVSQGIRGEHYDGPSMRRVLANAMADVPTGVSMQFVRWLREGRFDSVDRAHDYLAGVARIAVPTLVVAGNRDRLAPPDAVLEAHRRMNGRHVEQRVVGRPTGASHDYDHLDLILGGDALTEVFPYVRAWLEGESASAPERLA